MSELLYLPVGRVTKSERGAAPHGEFTGYASVWDNVDLQDDVVVRGAFAKSLLRWAGEGRRIPVVTGHDHEVAAVVGSLATAREDSYGLAVHGTYASTPESQSVRVKVAEGHLTGLSVFGSIVDSSWSTMHGRRVRMLREVDLVEVTLTPWPANTKALVSAAKALANQAALREMASVDALLGEELAARRRALWRPPGHAVAYAESVLKSAAPLDEQLADLEAYIGSVPSVAAGRFASWLRGGPSNGEGSEWTEGLS